MLQKVTFLIGFLCVSIISGVYAQSYNDGPIEIKVKLREIGNYYDGDDWAVFGTNQNSETEDFTYKLWFSDNLNLHPWNGYGPLGNPIEGPDNIINTSDDEAYTDDITQVSISGTNSQDFNSIVSVLSYNTSLVPEFLKMKFFAWEDDNPSDPFTALNWAGVSINNSGDRNVFESAYCQFAPWWLFGACAPLAFQGDDYGCEANPFYSGLDWRYTPNMDKIPPCSFYSHNQITGSGCVNNSNNTPSPNTDTYYRPHIETFWRYTKGTSFANAINLGTLSLGTSLQHFNSNECYTNYFSFSSGNDVIYSFDITNPTGINISLCGINGAQFDSYLYLVSDFDTTASIDQNDNACGGLQSQIITSICNPGTYYVVVDAVVASEFGTFTLEITEDPTNTFFVTDSISQYNGEDISCYNGDDGKFYAHVYGGIPPYTFNWSNGITNISNNDIDSLINLSDTIYSVTVSDANGCILPPLSVTLNAPDQISVITTSIATSCAGYADGIISITNTTGGTPSYSYSWNTLPLQTGTNATFLPAGIYTLTVTDNNGCIITHQDTVIEPPPPSMSISSSNSPISTNPLTFEVCDGDDINLIASPGLVSYSWAPNIWLNTDSGSTVFSSPNLPGITYTCTGTDLSGCTIDIPVVVDVVSSINIYPSIANPQVCEGEDITITFYGASNYSWFPPTYLNTTSGPTVTITPQDSITYTITAQNVSGCTDETNFFVDVLPAPNLNITSPVASICVGGSVPISVSGTNSYTWSPIASLNTGIGSVVTASPSATTQYKVVGTALNGCMDSIYTTISVNPLPVLNVTGTNSICSGESTNLLVSGANSYIWTPSNSLDTSVGNIVLANPTLSQVYTIVGTDLNQCEATISYTVSVLPSPNVSVFASQDTICIGSSSILSANGALSYNWLPSNSINVNTGVSVTAFPTTTTTYSVLGTSANNCSAIDTIIVHVEPLPILSVLPNITTICEGDSIEIVATGAQDFVWSPALGLNTTLGSVVTASPITSSSYFVTGTDVNGCSDVLSATINVNSRPSITLSSVPNTNNICEGSSLEINAFGAVSYTWNPSIGLNTAFGSSVIANPITSTYYTVTGTDINSCTNSANFQLNVGIKPIVSISPRNPVICEGENIALSANGANTYIWTPSTTLSSSAGAMVIANPLSSTTYKILGVDSLGCEALDSTTVNVNPLPTAFITQDSLQICSGDLGAILVDVSGTPPWDLTYTINGALQQEMINLTSDPIIISSDISGEYTLISIEDDNECTNIGSGSLFLDVLDMPIADFLAYGPDGSFEIDELQSQVSFINTSFFANSYSWYFGDPFNNENSNLTEPTYSYLNAGTYPVTLTAYNGPCIDDTTKNIYIKPVFNLWLPNSFTPDGNDNNDFFPPPLVMKENTSILEFEMYIFNSWGEEVFYSKDKNDCWNGKIKQNSKVVPGYYFYTIEIKDVLGVNHTQSGKVLLIN